MSNGSTHRSVIRLAVHATHWQGGFILDLTSRLYFGPTTEHDPHRQPFSAWFVTAVVGRHRSLSTDDVAFFSDRQEHLITDNDWSDHSFNITHCTGGFILVKRQNTILTDNDARFDHSFNSLPTDDTAFFWTDESA